MFQVGRNIDAAVRRDVAARIALAGLQVDRERLVVRAPEDDARVVAEQVDHLPRLAHGFLAGAARVAPLQREVLPEEQAGLVGRVVQLGPGDVRVDAEQVEVRLDREVDVPDELLGTSPPRAPSASARGSSPSGTCARR